MTPTNEDWPGDNKYLGYQPDEDHAPQAAAPGYWQHETSGLLRPVMLAYLNGELLDQTQIGIMRAYLRQWINAPAWRGADVKQLRRDVDTLTTRAAIRRWLDRAMEQGIDPL